MQQQPTDAERMQEVRRLWSERAAKEKELASIDRAINIAVGLEEEDRPKRPRLSRADIRNISRAPRNECVSTKKRQSLDSGVV